jgi:hypothetical protein
MCSALEKQIFLRLTVFWPNVQVFVTHPAVGLPAPGQHVLLLSSALPPHLALFVCLSVCLFVLL